MRDPLIEQVAFERGGEAETVEAAAAAVREEPLRAVEAQRLALAAQDEPLLLYPVGCPVLQHHRHGPDLTRGLRRRVREVPLLRELELERIVDLTRADVHERVPWLFDPRVRDRRHILPGCFVERAPEIIRRCVGLGVALKVDTDALAESVL